MELAETLPIRNAPLRLVGADGEELIAPPPPPRVRTDVDALVRPTTLDDIIGCDDLKVTLRRYMDAAKERGDALDHVLVTGPGGLGKTTIANVIAAEMGHKLILKHGPSMMNSDFSPIIGQIMENHDLGLKTVFFIDEIHKTDRKLMTSLLPIMEEFVWDSMAIPPFTMVGATTDPAAMENSLKDRFSIRYDLDFYADVEMAQIIIRSFCKLHNHPYLATKLEIEANEKLMAIFTDLGRRTRGVPRIGNIIVRRMRDFLPKDAPLDAITPELSRELMRALDIDQFGLNRLDRKYLEVLYRRFGGGPAGVNALAAAIGEKPRNLEIDVEPPLVRMGYIDRSPKGRLITHLGLDALEPVIQKAVVY